MKEISFKVAKAIEKLGYPQLSNGFYTEDGTAIYYPENCSMPGYYAITTYINVWLWLWDEKKLSVYPEESLGKWAVFEGNNVSREGYIYNDPEEAIANGIEYLLNKL